MAPVCLAPNAGDKTSARSYLAGVDEDLGLVAIPGPANLKVSVEERVPSFG